uniref:Uncharacterized protein n=1 Tax=Timema shepardi TaxID=629360 RepID=A0A7R9APJ8_TIMSH|nr:unnamed protein product [Timema shepardi]
MCHGLETSSKEDSRAKTEVDMELCIGLAVALAVFVLVGLFVVKILQRKGRDNRLYNRAASGLPAGDCQ